MSLALQFPPLLSLLLCGHPFCLPKTNICFECGWMRLPRSLPFLRIENPVVSTHKGRLWSWERNLTFSMWTKCVAKEMFHICKQLIFDIRNSLGIHLSYRNIKVSRIILVESMDRLQICFQYVMLGCQTWVFI